MIFDADCMVLKVESRPFIGREGKSIPYARATLLDNVGNVFEASCDTGLVPAVEALRQKVAICKYDLSKGKTSQGKDSLKMRLVAIEARPEPKK